MLLEIKLHDNEDQRQKKLLSQSLSRELECNVKVTPQTPCNHRRRRHLLPMLRLIDRLPVCICRTYSETSSSHCSANNIKCAEYYQYNVVAKCL